MYLLRVCLEKLLYFLGILNPNTPFTIFSKILFDHVFQAHLATESWIDLVKAEVGTSIDNRIKGFEEPLHDRASH